VSVEREATRHCGTCGRPLGQPESGPDGRVAGAAPRDRGEPPAQVEIGRTTGPRRLFRRRSSILRFGRL
jgi:hypothetical protein